MARTISTDPLFLSESRDPVIPVSIEEYFGRKVAQLFTQPVRLAIGEYQPIGDITPSVVRGDSTISLFTSGFNGAPPPSAVIDGSSITVDLSSLYMRDAWRDEFHIWNIGGRATGTMDLEMLEFRMNWNRLFRDKYEDKVVTFALRGIVLNGGPVPVPLGDTLLFFVSGLTTPLIAWRLKMTASAWESPRLLWGIGPPYGCRSAVSDRPDVESSHCAS